MQMPLRPFLLAIAITVSLRPAMMQTHITQAASGAMPFLLLSALARVGRRAFTAEARNAKRPHDCQLAVTPRLPAKHRQFHVLFAALTLKRARRFTFFLCLLRWDIIADARRQALPMQH